MNNITVVVKSGFFKDGTCEVSIPEKGDVKSWIQESLKPFREQLSSLEERISESQRKQRELQSITSSLKVEINTLSQNTKSNIDAFNQRLSKVENDKAQWENRFQALANDLSKDFISSCRADVQKYFTRLSEETKNLKEESRQIVVRQQSVSEQLALAVEIAGFFSKRYELQLMNCEKELTHITRLTAVLEKWNEQESQIPGSQVKSQSDNEPKSSSGRGNFPFGFLSKIFRSKRKTFDDETKALKEELRQNIERQKEISGQLALAVEIADFFCKKYELQVLNSENELTYIAQLAAVLEKWNKQESGIRK